MKSRKPRYDILLHHLLAIMIFLLATTPAWCVTVDLTGSPVTAYNSRPCAGTLATSNLNCTANEFTVSTTFSAMPGTPPMCIAGSTFDFQVDLQLSGSNTDRYDPVFYTGETGSSPALNDATKLCSVSAFPLSLTTPWANFDGVNSCADYTGGGDSIIRVNQIKVKCQGDASGVLSVPFTLAYAPNAQASRDNPKCSDTDTTTYPIPTSAKCVSGVSTVSGTVKVFSGAYLDVTKITVPSDDTVSSFGFTATGPATSNVIAMTRDIANLNDVYNPTTAASAGISTTASLTNGKKARFYINAIAANQLLTVTETDLPTNWESTASISCSAVTGSPTLTTNNANRTMSASLNTTNSAAACTITNTKRSKITLAKSVGVRVDTADQFTVSASGGGTLTGTTSATTLGSGTSTSTTFYSSPSTPLTLTDAKASGPTALTGYDTRLTCTNAFAGPGATPNSSLPGNLITASTSITPAPGDDITCTYTNTKKVNITLRKTWVNALVSDTVNVTSTGLATLNSVANSANETDTAAIQTLRPGDVTTIAEVFTVGNAANYTSVLSCSGNTTALAGNVLTVNSADTAITCTYTNTLKPATITVNKSIIPAASVDTFNLLVGATTVAAAVGNGGSGSTTVLAGTAVTVSETAANATDLSNYNTSYSCSGSITGTGTSVNITPSPGEAVVCTFTNSLKMPLLSILKSANKATSSPGEVIIYNVQIVNSGTGIGTNVVLTDDLSPYGAFGLNSYGAGIRFAFSDTASGLSLGTPQYSYTKGLSWFTPPTPQLVDGGGNAPPGYDGNVTNWKIPMSGTILPGGSFSLNYQVIVK